MFISRLVVLPKSYDLQLVFSRLPGQTYMMCYISHGKAKPLGKTFQWRRGKEEINMPVIDSEALVVPTRSPHVADFSCSHHLSPMSIVAESWSVWYCGEAKKQREKVELRYTLLLLIYS